MYKDYHVICIDSPLHKGIVYKYLVTSDQLELYNSITRNGTLMSLTIFYTLSMKGLFNKRYITNTSKIKL